MQDLDALRAHPLLSALTAPRRLKSVYFDTPDLALRAAGFALRIRLDGRRHVQTVKTLGGGAGLYDRGEWEHQVDGPTPDLAIARATPLAAILAQDGVADRLKRRFTVEVERATALVGEAGVQVELSLDLGEARAGARRAPIVELELELKRGEPSDLFALAGTLFEAAPLRLSARSKAEVGFDLIAPAEAIHAAPVDLHRDLTAGQAFRTVGRACLGHFLPNARLIVARRTVESVHQARVAVRRLRAAMTLFKDLLADPRSQGLGNQLKALGLTLGAARDLDVLIERLDTLETSAPVDREALQAALRRRREVAYDAAVRGLESPATGRLGFDLAAWLEAGVWATDTDPRQAARRDQPVRRFAAAELSRRARKLRRQALALADMDPAERHEVRKAAKKVRYGAEFFRSLARKKDRKAVKAFLDALKPLQETLGDLNDATTAQRLLQALAEDPDSAGVLAAGAVVEEVSIDSEQRLAAAVAAAKRFAKTDDFL